MTEEEGVKGSLYLVGFRMGYWVRSGSDRVRTLLGRSVVPEASARAEAERAGHTKISAQSLW